MMDMLPFHFPGISGVGCAFGTRRSGNISLDFLASGLHPRQQNEWDATAARRSALPTALGVRAFAEVHQIHGVRTLFDPEKQNPLTVSTEDADGLATSSPGLALMIKTADCQPILLAHSSGRHIAALHSGWKGNRQSYPYSAVCEFCEHYHIEPADVWAVRGPSLGPAAAEFIHFQEEWGPEFLPWYDNTRQTMDLWELTRHQLSRAGLLPRHILELDLCTFDNAELFFSYRHSRKYGSPDGRQGSFIWIQEN